MSRIRTIIVACQAIFFCLIGLALPQSVKAVGEEDAIAEVVVTAQRREQQKLEYSGNIDRIDTDTIEEVQYQHIHELLARVAGVWVVRGAGQEHLTAIRSPMLTGAGSCGGFLFLEDGIPIRPSGFCNVNQFLEMYAEQAGAVEVIRGPGNALFGSNALHGIVNVLMPQPGVVASPRFSIEAGANDFTRIRAAMPFEQDSPWFTSVTYSKDGGFRADSGYEQAKMHIKHAGKLLEGDFKVGFTATYLDQETAGFVFGKDAYKDPVLRLTNPNPEAFRDANSQRLYGLWTRSFENFDLDIRPFVRHSKMEFLHHFRPGLPAEENGQVSAGALSAATFTGEKQQTVLGVDLEWSDVFLKQTQALPAEGSVRVQETFPVGKHYDYEVSSVSIAAFSQTDFQINHRLSLGAGVRFEYIEYDYQNQMIDGNTRDDGSQCGFGGCVYSRPADRTDSYTNFTPKFSAGFILNEQTRLFAGLARGFRAPQMTELYRLQSGQLVSDLDSEIVDSFEVGIRTSRDSWSGDVVFYTMRKSDSVFRDAEGFNVSGARSRHGGVELALDWQLATQWRLSLDASYAIHRYDFTFEPERGESFISGRDIDTAPRRLGSLELFYAPTLKWRLGVQLAHNGGYFLDAENRFTYPGHTIANFQAAFVVNPKIELLMRLKNVTDKFMADRGDYANGNYRYLPGRGLELFAELRYSLSQ
ncbi:MAG: iron complex outermembrane receptor protein [Lysobacterales bacterium]|jgi:iron complex outermembrane receptor protein